MQYIFESEIDLIEYIINIRPDLQKTITIRSDFEHIIKSLTRPDFWQILSVSHQLSPLEINKRLDEYIELTENLIDVLQNQKLKI